MNRTTLTVPRRCRGIARLFATASALTLFGCASPNPFQDDQSERDVPRTRYSNVITADDIAQYPTTSSIQEVLERFVPGLRVTSQSSVSILGMGNPVFVVDGVILDVADMALGMNPHDVERIEVLKHGESNARYGFRGSNGAIVIMTKR
jgi:TonB-dependent SusC/RagA subfamily outer membrane receptor